MNRYGISVAPDLDFVTEVNVTGLGDEPGGLADVTGLAGMISSVRDHGTIGYLTENGRRVAAVVPVR